MTKKKSAAHGRPDVGLPSDSALMQAADPVLMKDLSHAAIADFSAERDVLLQSSLPGNAMPETEEAFYARDPFSADYGEFLKTRVQERRGSGPRVNAELRADLLSKPYLMERPEEAAHRGAAAVWRSLRDQLHSESLTIIDTSGREEIVMLQRDLETRKALVASVAKGIDHLLKRLEQRLADIDPKPGDLKPGDLKPTAPAATAPAATASAAPAATAPQTGA